jgi:hypothetical protein
MQDAEAIYQQLKVLCRELPNFLQTGSMPAEAHLWLGRLSALVASMGDPSLITELREAERELAYRGVAQSEYERRRVASHIVTAQLYRALAIAESKLPKANRGGFLPAATPFSAMMRIGEILKSGTRDILIIDPYLDEVVLNVFARQASEGVRLRLLAANSAGKSVLKEAVTRWLVEYGNDRPLEARLINPKRLHDRLIVVDGTAVWDLSQSFNHFAERSPATIAKSDEEPARLKVDAYEDLWVSATPI